MPACHDEAHPNLLTKSRGIIIASGLENSPRQIWVWEYVISYSSYFQNGWREGKRGVAPVDAAPLSLV
jgi:hypothetical protein